MTSTESSENPLDVVTLEPHVAAAIIEHAKRRLVASGYLLGQKTADSLQVMDFMPYTVPDKVSAKDVTARLRIMRPFTSHTIIGWYSACCTRNADGTDNDSYQVWVKSPGGTFATDSGAGKNAIHLHCEMPHREGGANTKLSISWSANLTLIKRLVGAEVSQVAVINVKPLQVSISANGHKASNVVLAHVRNAVLFNGEKPHDVASLMYLDDIAFQQTSRHQNAGEALLTVQKQLKDLVAQQGKNEEVRTLVNEIRQLMDSASSTTEANGKDDVVTQRLKDALMIKCLSSLLRKSVSQIDLLSSQYPDGGHNNSNSNHNSNANHHHKQRENTQQAPPADGFRANFSNFSRRN